MNSKMLAAIATIVIVSVSFCVIVDSSDAEAGTETHKISEYVGDYYWYNSGESEFQKRAVISQGTDGGYVLTVTNISDVTTAYKIGKNNDYTSDVESTVTGTYPDLRINFELYNGGMMWFPVEKSSTGKMKVSYNLFGDNTNYECYRSGDIIASELPFNPATLNDAIVIANKIVSNNLSVVLPDGKYNFNVAFNGTGTLSINGSEGAIIDASPIEVTNSNNSANLSINNVCFGTDETNGHMMNIYGFKNVSIVGCEFNNVLVFQYNDATEKFTFNNNTMTGDHSYIGGSIFAVSGYAKSLEIKDNTIDGYVSAMSMGLSGSSSDSRSEVISGNTINDLGRSDDEGVAIHVFGNLAGVGVGVSENRISGASIGLSVNGGSTFDETTILESSSNEFSDCDNTIFYDAKEDGTIAKVPLKSTNDHAYDSNGKEIEIVVKSGGEAIPSDILTIETDYKPDFSGGDEDDEFPFIPGQNSSGKDDTTTYIAVAAAAAVVAVLAVLVMAMNKGKL